MSSLIDNEMSLKDLFLLEIEGISETICGYSIENFIQSYSRQLLELDFEKDTFRIGDIFDRLIEWYDQNINIIYKSQFVNNKNEHKKSYRLLIELRSQLDQYIAD